MATNTTQTIVIGVISTYVSPAYINTAFYLLLFGEVVSTPCYLFMLYHLFDRKITRQNLQNHSIFILLIFNFIYLMIDLTLTLDYLRLGYRSLFIPSICLLHTYVAYGFWYGSISLMLWISIERHILVFHSNLMATVRRRFLFHHIPLGISSSYALILYFYLIILCPCERLYTPQKNLCGAICFRNVVPAWYNFYESFVNYVIPLLLIAVLSIGLIVRVIMQRRRLQQTIEWRRYIKMINQLTLISMVYLIFDLPYVIVTIVQWSGFPTFAGTIISPYLAYLTYVPAIILPYATLMTLSSLKRKLRALIIFRTN